MNRGRRPWLSLIVLCLGTAGHRGDARRPAPPRLAGAAGCLLLHRRTDTDTGASGPPAAAARQPAEKVTAGSD